MTYDAAQARELTNYRAKVYAKFHDRMFKNLSETATLPDQKTREYYNGEWGGG